MASPIESVCFDLGNVICDFNFQHAVRRFSEELSHPLDAVRRALVFDDVYIAYERGDIGTGEYRAELARRLGRPIPAPLFDGAWNAIFEGLRPGMEAIISELAETLPVTVLSNTNAAHAKFWRRTYAAALAPCAALFTSFELRARKPDPRAFRAVIEFVGCPPEGVLFFDDMEANVLGARAEGLTSIHVTSEDSVSTALRYLDLIR